MPVDVIASKQTRRNFVFHSSIDWKPTQNAKMRCSQPFEFCLEGSDSIQRGWNYNSPAVKERKRKEELFCWYKQRDNGILTD